MAISKDQKAVQIQEITEKMAKAQSVIFAHYIGLNVADVSNFRNALVQSNAEMKVAKKTLAKIAAKAAGLPDIEDSSVPGPVSLIFSYNDPSSGAQVAFKFSKKHEQIQIIGGIFGGKILTKAEANELASLPSREVLLATFMGMMQSPFRGFASSISSPLSSFARVLSTGAKEGKIGTKA